MATQKSWESNTNLTKRIEKAERRLDKIEAGENKNLVDAVRDVAKAIRDQGGLTASEEQEVDAGLDKLNKTLTPKEE
jgi:2-oxo-4-hydroxy-4-carboxy--5-ureidoimidazoline (OHCU) decarboxylase